MIDLAKFRCGSCPCTRICREWYVQNPCRYDLIGTYWYKDWTEKQFWWAVERILARKFEGLE